MDVGYLLYYVHSLGGGGVGYPGARVSKGVGYLGWGRVRILLEFFLVSIFFWKIWHNKGLVPREGRHLAYRESWIHP